MAKKTKNNIPSSLSQYLRLKSEELKLSENQLSKLIIPGSSGSLIASIRFDESKLSEKKIGKIATFLKDDPIVLTFLAGKIPKSIHEMIIKNKEVQNFLIDIFDILNKKKNK
jgi:hypothetical protein